jgi:putative membrane protein
LGFRAVRVMTHPVTAAVVNAGGLWALYTTGLFRATGEHPWVHLAVHTHVLVAGYLFTAAVIGVDPVRHRPGRRTRAVVLVGFIAAHAILAKYLYGHPPAGLLGGAAREGAELMYYGGDVVDAVLIVALCREWYRATDPRRRTGSVTPRIPNTRPPGRPPWRLPEEFSAAR